MLSIRLMIQGALDPQTWMTNHLAAQFCKLTENGNGTGTFLLCMLNRAELTFRKGMAT